MPMMWSPTLGDVKGVAYNNTTATTDPGLTNDQTQGYSAGSLWVNTSAVALRIWICRSSATGAAAWQFVGADYASGGSNPSSEVNTGGGSGGNVLLRESGNIFTSVGSGATLGGTAGDFVIGTYTLPANFFDIAGRGLTITAQGAFAPNVTAKRVKLWANVTGGNGTLNTTIAASNGTVIADTGSLTTGASGSGWCLSCNVFKYGVLGSNTQVSLHEIVQVSTAISVTGPQLLTATESGAITFCCTGNAATNVSDISINFFEVTAYN